MITICSVIISKIDHYKKIFIESIVKSTSLVSEVIFANNSENPGYFREWQLNNIKFKEYGSQENFPHKECGHQHAFGLHYAIDRATNKYVYLCDPDIFFYCNTDVFLFELMHKHELQAVGMSHHSAAQLGGTYFPWHGNVLMKKTNLPNERFLENELPIREKYLMAGIGWKQREQYPNPTGNFDTASALWLWASNNNWKWLSFQTTDAHTYTTQYFRGNFKIKEKFERKKLLYHAISGAIEKEAWEPFLEKYNDNIMLSNNIYS